jgi:hypothetical protein
MAKRNSSGPKQHAFRNKLLLNQWLIFLFGIDPLADNELNGIKVRPFNKLADPIKDQRLEGLDSESSPFLPLSWQLSFIFLWSTTHRYSWVHHQPGAGSCPRGCAGDYKACGPGRT